MILLYINFTMLNTFINDRYDEGYQAGYQEGYNAGIKTLEGSNVNLHINTTPNPCYVIKNIPFFAEVDILNTTGYFLESIQMGEPIEEDCDTVYENHKCLGSIFKKNLRPIVAFGKLESYPGDDYYILNLKDSDCEWNASIPYDLKNPHKKIKINEFLNKYRKDAQYGDMTTLETKTDHCVRKGYDIDLTDPDIKKQIYVPENIINELKKLFSEKMGIYAIKVTPYKFNIYEEGDFFVCHRDSPEKNLIGTIVVHIDGDYDCMIIGTSLWKSNLGHVAMFYTDVSHEITKVPNYRQSLSLKVWSTNTESPNELIPFPSLLSSNAGLQCDKQSDNDSTSSDISKDKNLAVIKELNSLVTLGPKFSILLQSGYIHDNLFIDTNEQKNQNETDHTYLIQNLKGNDRTIYEVITTIGYSVRFVPIVLKDQTDVERYTNYNPHNNNSSEEDEWEENTHEFHNYSNRTKVSYGYQHHQTTGEAQDIENCLNIYTAGETMLEALYKIDNKQAKKLHSLLYDDLKYARIYYLGKGYKIGSHEKKNMHIGNQCTGSAKDNVYLNIMMFCYKK